MAKHLSKSASKTLDAILTGLYQPGDARKIDNANGSFMAVNAECIGDCRFSVSHTYIQNGDVMTDPEMTFFLAEDGNYYPMTFEMSGLAYRVGIEFGDDSSILRWSPRENRDQVSFASTWLANIKSQQGGLKALR